MRSAPFPPLVTGAEGLERRPEPPRVLRARMAEVYGVAAESLLPVRGMLHGAALVLRLAARAGAENVVAPSTPELRRLAEIAGLSLVAEANAATGAVFIASPSADDGRVVSGEPAATLAARSRPALVVVDESLIEFADAASLAELASRAESLVVIRSLEFARGLMGDPCGALIASPKLIGAIEDVLEPDALSTTTVRLALSALDPSRAGADAQRFAEVKAERERVLWALCRSPAVVSAAAAEGPFVFATPKGVEAARREVGRFAVRGEWLSEACFRIDIGAAETNDRALAAFGAADLPAARRRAEVVRETLETRIVARVDLDAEGGSTIETGVGFFDHMLAQVAAHGGFRIILRCDGDLNVDSHHTIEDCALALGQALKQALGARRGIARYGFVLPMDEAEAKASIDLGGRPYLVFDGTFHAPLIGAYPTEMTEHVFRSLAQSLGASIHIAVAGGNDHHKTEACFKALGRVLREAMRVEGRTLPSTKGVIA
jgi:imidazoleglycerol-phosphate dehydratase / histidinol-phosphatase